jgi:hypothetical protein
MNYLDEEVARSRALQAIMRVCLPGDVININSRDSWWNIVNRFGHWGIRTHQKALFGPDACWKDTHDMLYFDVDKIFSVELPRAKWAHLNQYALDRLTVWRFTKFELGPEELKLMEDGARPIIGKTYDIGQLADIALNHLYDHPQEIRYKVFDWGEDLKVCSVGVRLAYEYMRKNLPPGKTMKRLFSTFRYHAWAAADKVQKLNTFGKGVDVEATAPAHFANSDYFDDEFAFVAAFDRGKLLLHRDELVAGSPRPPKPCPIINGLM